jgi:riboflavin synthase
MFTGIILAVGSVAGIDPMGGDTRLRIHAGGLGLADTKLGDSIAVNGVCLTAVELTADGFAADVSGETLSRTTLGALKRGAPVNLELALTPSTRLGGHLVSGHVDGIGRLLDRRTEGRSQRLRFEAPAGLAKYIAEKGSICVDGVSLTVNSVEGARFGVNVVPHTLGQTTLGSLAPGDPVNLEVDLLARYLERLLLGDKAAGEGGGITREFLARHGFIK